MAAGGGGAVPGLGGVLVAGRLAHPGEAVRGLPVAGVGGHLEPALGAHVAPVLHQIAQRVRPERVPVVGGEVQPVLRGLLLALVAQLQAERVRGRRAARHGGLPPPLGGLGPVALLVQQDAQVVGGGAQPGGGGAAQVRLGVLQVAAAQQQGAEPTGGLRVAVVGGLAVPALQRGLFAGGEGRLEAVTVEGGAVGPVAVGPGGAVRSALPVGVRADAGGELLGGDVHEAVRAVAGLRPAVGQAAAALCGQRSGPVLRALGALRPGLGVRFARDGPGP